MRKKSVLLTTMFILMGAAYGYSQTASPAMSWVEAAAKRMKDSLGLSTPQHDSILTVNKRLMEESIAVRRLGLSPDSLQVRLQKVENLRDQLYQPVLGNEKYLLYKSKKRVLLFGQ